MPFPCIKISSWVNCYHLLLCVFSFPKKLLPTLSSWDVWCHFTSWSLTLEDVYLFIYTLRFVGWDLRIGLWGWLAWPLHSRRAPNLTVTPSLLWKWFFFFRYRTYIPYRYYSRGLKAYVQTKTCARMFTPALFTIALKWKQKTQMFLNEQITKQNMFCQYNGIIVFGHKDE